MLCLHSTAQFGFDVSISDNFAIVGDRTNYEMAGSAGAAFIFMKNMH